MAIPWAESPSSPVDFGLGQGTCSCHWDGSRYNERRDLRCVCVVVLAFLHFCHSHKRNPIRIAAAPSRTQGADMSWTTAWSRVLQSGSRPVSKIHILMLNAAEILKWFVMQHYYGNRWLIKVARRIRGSGWQTEKVCISPAVQWGLWETP